MKSISVKNMIVKKRRKNWVYKVRNLLNTLGLNFRPMWELQRKLNMGNCNAYFGDVNQRIRDQFIQSFYRYQYECEVTEIFMF